MKLSAHNNKTCKRWTMKNNLFCHFVFTTNLPAIQLNVIFTHQS